MSGVDSRTRGVCSLLSPKQRLKAGCPPYPRGESRRASPRRRPGNGNRERQMIRFIHGDIFAQKAEALVNPVNCVGVMGRGLALEFKKRFPHNFQAYRAACGRGEVQPGILLVSDSGTEEPRYIINLPTKRHWRDRSMLPDVDAGLRALAQRMEEERIGSAALPALGCGLGGLPWPAVRELTLRRLGDLDAEIIVLKPPERTPGTDARDKTGPGPRVKQ